MTRALLEKKLQELDAQMARLGALVEHALAQVLEALKMGGQDKPDLQRRISLSNLPDQEGI